METSFSLWFVPFFKNCSYGPMSHSPGIKLHDPSTHIPAKKPFEFCKIIYVDKTF